MRNKARFKWFELVLVGVLVLLIGFAIALTPPARPLDGLQGGDIAGAIETGQIE